MKTKLMAFILVSALLASLSTAVAAYEMSAQPMVEEFISEHSTSDVTAQPQGDTDAVANIIETDGEVIVHDLARNQRIDYLFYLRSQFELDFEENMEEILRIDQELRELGVETLTNEEIVSKMGNTALPMVELPTSPSTNWTSRRVMVTYAGQHYDLQIIEGVPTSTSSSLWIDDGFVSHTAEGFMAGTLNVIDAKLCGATGSIPIVGDVITVYDAFAEIAETYNNAFSETTIVESATGVALITMKTHMKFIYVKGYGSGDQMQLLSYVGNSVYYLITSTTSKPFMINGELQPKHVTASYEATEESDFYTDYSVPVKTYYQLRNYVAPVVTVDYSFKTLDVYILDKWEEMVVPYEMMHVAN